MGYIYTRKAQPVLGHKITKRSKNKIPFYQCECGFILRHCATEPAYDKDDNEIAIYVFDHQQIIEHLQRARWAT